MTRKDHCKRFPSFLEMFRVSPLTLGVSLPFSWFKSSLLCLISILLFVAKSLWEVIYSSSSWAFYHRVSMTMPQLGCLCSSYLSFVSKPHRALLLDFDSPFFFLLQINDFASFSTLIGIFLWQCFA